MIINSVSLTGNRTIYQFRGQASNIYIVVDHGKGRTFLIDCGMPSDTASLMEALRPLPPLKRIVCTHFHVDHVSGWILLKRFQRNCKLLFHQSAGPFVTGDRRLPFPSFHDYFSILIPCMRDYGYVPGLRDIFIGGLYGTPFKKGFPLERVTFFANQQMVVPSFKTVPTPGHRPDSVSFFDQDSGILVSGDFLVVIGGRLLNNKFLTSQNDQQRSISKILRLKTVRFVWPGHGVCKPFSADELNPV